jgi:NAD(P)-dependent dehydrogenase (short-subunit alcohol dehydrogenase family)
MSVRLDLVGKTALVTGAAGGIGFAAAQQLRGRGANVVLVDLSRSALDRRTAVLGDEQTLAIAADVTDAAAMEHAVTEAVDRFGRLDIVFANAGITANPPATMLTTDPSDFEKVVDVDLLGVYRTVRPALPQVVANRGHILMTASIFAFQGGPVNAPYAVAKAGVEQLGRALRAELVCHQASAGVLYPGWVDTALVKSAYGDDEILTRLRSMGFPGPLGRRVSPDVVGRAVADGIERRAARIFVPRWWSAFSMLRGILGPLADARLQRDKTIAALIGELEQARSTQPEPSSLSK